MLFRAVCQYKPFVNITQHDVINDQVSEEIVTHIASIALVLSKAV